MSLLLASPHVMTCLDNSLGRQESAPPTERSRAPSEDSISPTATPTTSKKQSMLPTKYRPISNVSSKELDDVKQGPLAYTFCEIDDILARHVESSPASKKTPRSPKMNQSLSSIEWSAAQQHDEHSLMDANNLHNSCEMIGGDWNASMDHGTTKIGSYLKGVVSRRRSSSNGTDGTSSQQQLVDIAYPDLSPLERLKQQQAHSNSNDHPLGSIQERSDETESGEATGTATTDHKKQNELLLNSNSTSMTQPMLVKGLLADKARLHATMDKLKQDHATKVADWEHKYHDQQAVLQAQQERLHQAADEQAALQEQLDDRDLTIQLLQSQLAQSKECQRQVEQRLEWILQDCEDDGYGDVEPSESVIAEDVDLSSAGNDEMESKPNHCKDQDDVEDEPYDATTTMSGGPKPQVVQNLYARVHQLQVEKDASHEQVDRLSHSLADSQRMIDHLKSQVDGYNQMISKIVGPAIMVDPKNTTAAAAAAVKPKDDSDAKKGVASILPRRFSGLSGSYKEHTLTSLEDTTTSAATKETRGMSMSTNHIHSVRRVSGMDGSRLGNLRARFWGSTAHAIEEEEGHEGGEHTNDKKEEKIVQV